jgi:hypothetical protein
MVGVEVVSVAAGVVAKAEAVRREPVVVMKATGPWVAMEAKTGAVVGIQIQSDHRGGLPIALAHNFPW